MDLFGKKFGDIPEHLQEKIILHINPRYIHLWEKIGEKFQKIESQYHKKWYSILSDQKRSILGPCSEGKDNALKNAISLEYIDFVEKYLTRLNQNSQNNQNYSKINFDIEGALNAAIDIGNIDWMRSLIEFIDTNLKKYIGENQENQIERKIFEDFDNCYRKVIEHAVVSGNLKMIDILLPWIDSWGQLDYKKIKKLFILSGANPNIITYLYSIALDKNIDLTDFLRSIQRVNEYSYYLLHHTLLDLLNNEDHSPLKSSLRKSSLMKSNFDSLNFQREIYLAIHNNQIEVLKNRLRLKSLNPDRFQQYYTSSFLHQALQEGNLEAVKILLPIEEDFGYLLDDKKYYHLFTYTNDLDIIEYLIEQMKTKSLTIFDVLNYFESYFPTNHQTINVLTQFIELYY